MEEKGQATLEVAKEEDATPKARCPQAEVIFLHGDSPLGRPQFYPRGYGVTRQHRGLQLPE